MKNTLFALAILCACAANAQTETKVPPTAPAVKTESTTTVATTAVSPTPAAASTAKSDNIRPEDFLPVLGSYKTATNTQLTIAVDATNVGIVWVEGLPQGKFKAMLRQSPATYKIPAQKSETGKIVNEGTLYFNPETKEAKILFGAYNDSNPTAVFEGKTKSKVITVTKAEPAN